MVVRANIRGGAWRSERGGTTRRSVKEIYGRKKKVGGMERVGRGKEGRSWFSLEGKVSLR